MGLAGEGSWEETEMILNLLLSALKVIWQQTTNFSNPPFVYMDIVIIIYTHVVIMDTKSNVWKTLKMFTASATVINVSFIINVMIVSQN